MNTTLEKSEYKLSSGRIITGQEEAVSGWTIVNYLGNRLQKPVSSLKRCMFLNALIDDRGAAKADVCAVARGLGHKTHRRRAKIAPAVTTRWTIYARQ